MNEKDIFLLGGGSNILFTRNMSKLVVHINIKGIHIDHENDKEVHITAHAGESWHKFVIWCIANNYGGLENLSLIPGNVGSSPIQNIGAYGVEVKNVITKVEGLEIESGKKLRFSNSECQFGYRNSIFKSALKNKVVLTSVSFKLSKQFHKLSVGYGAIKSELRRKNIDLPSIKDVSDAVMKIRMSKLPDPKKTGNCGSFFKNPIITENAYKKLAKKHSSAPFYRLTNPKENDNAYLYKIPAGWLIETAGFKGKHFGNCGVHKYQALVLVNYSNATGEEIYQLAKKIQRTILNQFEIHLEIEVNVV